MAFHLMPDALPAMYECLRSQPPFRRWKLPSSDSVEFRATAIPDAGTHRGGDPHVITVSLNHNTNFVEAMFTLMHEMCHAAEDVAKKPVGHGNGFRRRVKAVSKALGVDEKDVYGKYT